MLTVLNKPFINLFFSTFFLFLSFNIWSQTPKSGRYWVYFKDKSDASFNLLQPEKFLSARAIERRQRYGISIDSTDLPVNVQYVHTLRQKGHFVFYSSKWFNAALILSDSAQNEALATLPFIKNIEFAGPELMKKKEKQTGEKSQKAIPSKYEPVPNYYGYGALQIAMANGHVLHELGYDGHGVMVAVFDGGFNNVHLMPFFDSLRADNRLHIGRDFVDADSYLFESGNHGAQVLSVMGSKLPGLLVGSAPGASFVLFKTEDSRRESWTEEYNWLAAAEYADSAGIDIINSSLGYMVFSDSTMNYSYSNMDGRTSRVAKAANLAFSKGLIVVNSAGNEGNSSWKYITTPADGLNVFAVGAVDPNGKPASFSSFGPTSDGRIKPEIAVMGQSVMVGSTKDCRVVPAHGTSFASPLAAGMIASLWQAFPEKTNAEILEAIKKSSSLYEQPNDKLGLGIPDFWKAFVILMQQKYQPLLKNTGTISATLEGVFFVPALLQGQEIEWYDSQGKRIGIQKLTTGINKLSADIRSKTGQFDLIGYQIR